MDRSAGHPVPVISRQAERISARMMQHDHAGQHDQPNGLLIMWMLIHQPQHQTLAVRPGML
jgi:hypothetical protein